MTFGKNNKRTVKVSKKGGKKKVIDALSKKEWYKLTAPAVFQKRRNFGITCVSKTQGTKLSTDSLKQRIFEVNLADLKDPVEEDSCYRKIKLICEDVQGRGCLTDFHGMDMTRDKLSSIINKWHSLIEASIDVKTKDSYHLRMFCIAFTHRRDNQTKTTCYAKTTQIKRIRQKMRDVMKQEASSNTLNELVKKFIPESIGSDFTTKYQHIFPLENVYIRKVKVLKRPKFDLSKLMEIHRDEPSKDTGKSVGPVNLVTASVAASDNVLAAEAKQEA